MSRQFRDIKADTFSSVTSAGVSAVVPQGAFESLTASDSVSLTKYATNVTTGSSLTVSLGSGTAAGQLKLIRKVGGANTLVVTSSVIKTYTTATMASDSVARHVLFQWDASNSEWVVVDQSGVALA